MQRDDSMFVVRPPRPLVSPLLIVQEVARAHADMRMRPHMTGEQSACLGARTHMHTRRLPRGQARARMGGIGRGVQVQVGWPLRGDMLQRSSFGLLGQG